MDDLIIENATLVLPDRVQRGWLAVFDGLIAEVGAGRAPRGLARRGADRLMPGRLDLVVGPSGAGKDMLIRLARAALACEPRYVFPRRLVTRPPSADEDNDPIDEAAFAAG